MSMDDGRRDDRPTTHEARAEPGAGYLDLARAINKYGQRRAQHYLSDLYDTINDEEALGLTEIEVKSWAYGPLLYIKSYNSEGKVKVAPTIGKSMVQVILEAGYVPFGFRPNRSRNEAGNYVHEEGTFMWYLHPRDGLEELYDTKFAIEDEDGYLIRDKDGHAVTFANRGSAKPFALELGGEVVEVID